MLTALDSGDVAWNPAEVHLIDLFWLQVLPCIVQPDALPDKNVEQSRINLMALHLSLIHIFGLAIRRLDNLRLQD